MIGKNALKVARQHGHSPTTMWRVYWAWTEGGVDSDIDAERIFTSLADGGQVLMPMEQTFFASRFGQVRDRFGINWMILHERPVQDTRPSL